MEETKDQVGSARTAVEGAADEASASDKTDHLLSVRGLIILILSLGVGIAGALVSGFSTGMRFGAMLGVAAGLVTLVVVSLSIAGSLHKLLKRER